MVAVVVEDMVEGTITTEAAMTTPMDIPMGMPTHGLNIVVKLDAFDAFCLW